MTAANINAARARTLDPFQPAMWLRRQLDTNGIAGANFSRG
jgi:hypothetical protein